MPRKTRYGRPVVRHDAAASMRPRPDAAENAASCHAARSRCSRFNEAAARCRGKRLRRDRRGRDRSAASMRPRPDAAENPPHGRPQVEFARASMRPRPDAAENLPAGVVRMATRAASMRPRPDAAENRRGRRGGRGPAVASMRPRPDAAENRVSTPAARRRAPVASMRPRPDAAENPRRCGRYSHDWKRFNEAAARCRGKHET